MDLGHLVQVPWLYITIISIKSCRLYDEVVKRFTHYVSVDPTDREFEPHRLKKKKKKVNAQKSWGPLPNMGGSLTFNHTAILLS